MDAEQSAELTGTNRPCGLAISLRQTSKYRARDSDCEVPRPFTPAKPAERSDFWTKTRSTVSGGDFEEATPDPIPNSEVKLLGADGTAREAVWESRTLPGFFPERARNNAGSFAFVARCDRPRSSSCSGSSPSEPTRVTFHVNRPGMHAGAVQR